MVMGRYLWKMVWFLPALPLLKQKPNVEVHVSLYMWE